MSAPTIIGTPSNSTFAGSGSGTTTALSIPSNVANDILLIIYYGVESGTTSVPGGWTEIMNEFYDFPADSNYTVRAWYKVSNGSEGSSINLTHNAFTLLNAVMLVIRGAENPATTPIVDAVAFDETEDVNNPSPSLTVTDDDSLIIRLVGQRFTSITYTPPAGHTEIFEVSDGAWGSTAIAVTEADTGATGTATFVNSLGWPSSFVLPAFALAPTAADTTPPEHVSTTIATNGTDVDFLFDEAVNATDADGLSLDMSGGATTLTLASGSGTNTLRCTSSRQIADGETGNSEYDDTLGTIQDITGNLLESFGPTAVVNNSEYVVPTGPIYSATINADGEQVVLSLDSARTITNADGWSITFDNHAGRTLNYVSGSGTDEFVFSLSAIYPSTDGRAPVGVTGTIVYDEATGNVSDLTDTTEALTNNSTQIPRPDLPRNLPTAALPTNWNATADYTPADGTALQTLINTWVRGTGGVIELSVSVDYGNISMPENFEGNADEWIVFRSANYANLPNFSLYNPSGIITNDYDNDLATLSRTPSSEGHNVLNISGGASGPGAGYIRFIGIDFRMNGSYGTDVLAIVSTLTGGLATAVDKLPHHLGFDRCKFSHAGTMKGVQDALRLDTDDSFVVGCNFTGLKGAGNDGSNSMRHYNGHRILVQNNSLNSNGAGGFLGDNDDTVVEDYRFTRNHHFRDLGWDTGNGNNKGSWECKTGLRIQVDRNVFNRQFNESGFGAITVKAEGTGGPKTTNHFTATGNLMLACGQAYVILVGGSSDDADVGPNTDLLFEHGLAYDLTRRAIQLNVYDHNTNAPMERLQIIHNTLFGGFNVDGSDAGETPGKYCIINDNIFDGEFGTYFVNNGANGAQGLNYTWGADYESQGNLWIGESASNFDDDTTPEPLGTLANNEFPADIAAVGFVDPDNDNYAVSGSSDYVTTSTTNGKPGYGSSTYDPLWNRILTGESGIPDTTSVFSPSLSMKMGMGM